MNSNDSSDSRARDVHDLARHGNHVALGNLLSGMSTSERNAALETRTKDDGIQFTTPLIIAASFGYLDCVQILLTYNANIEARGTIDEKHAFLDSWYRERRGPPAMRANFDIIEGCTALCVAAAYGHLEVVKMLVEANKYSAAYSGKRTRTRQLLAPKASPTLRVVWVEMAPMSMQLTIPGVLH